jgi:hypothetical protein
VVENYFASSGGSMVQTVYNSNDTGRGALSLSSSGVGRMLGVKGISRLSRGTYEG